MEVVRTNTMGKYPLVLKMSVGYLDCRENLMTEENYQQDRPPIIYAGSAKRDAVS